MSQPEKILFDNRIKRKNVLALNEKVAAIREFEKTPVYKHVGRSFNCSPDQIKRIIQQKDEILKAWEQRTRRSNEVKSLEMKAVRVSMLGKSVYEWIRRMMYYKDFIITDGLIQKMALQFKSALGIRVFFPHQDWCDKFRQMYKITDNDTKKLKIAYLQGHSVQIKDIIRDILLPEHPSHSEISRSSTGSSDNESNSADENDLKPKVDCVVDDYEELEEDDRGEKKEDEDEEMRIETKRRRRRIPKKRLDKSNPNVPTPPPTIARRHLVAVKLPLSATQSNHNLPQQVLVATPITPVAPGQGPPPMTMTIIPLASVAQTLNTAKPHLPNEKPIVPPPKVEIKREIEDDVPLMTIKEERISDDEDAEGSASNVNDKRHFHEEEKFVNKINALSSSKDEIEKMDSEISEEEDNLALAQLQRGLMNKSQSCDNNGGSSTSHNSKRNTAGRVPSPKSWHEPNTPPPLLPAMPPLTRAPTTVASTSSNKRRHANFDRSPPLPPISTCAEARKYLKLLEDFALVKENFRLIGLITRADEVLRELDGDEDVDVV